jgi:hypothetical protein
MRTITCEIFSLYSEKPWTKLARLGQAGLSVTVRLVAFFEALDCFG